MIKKRTLGRPLHALLEGVGNNIPVTTAPAHAADHSTQHNPLPMEHHTLTTLSIHALTPGVYQPRRDISEQALAELADSIRAQGIIQPIIVRSINNGLFEILAGERRWRAAQLAGLHEVPVIVKSVSDEEALAIALIENIQRQDLNAIEEALALQRLMTEFELTHEAVAAAVGRSRTTVTNLLRLLNLSTEVQTLLARGQLEKGHALVLLSLAPEQQTALAQKIADKKFSVRQVEAWVKKITQSDATTDIAATTTALNDDIAAVAQKLSQQLATDVLVKQNAKGHGKIIIEYKNIENLRAIIAKFQW